MDSCDTARPSGSPDRGVRLLEIDPVDQTGLANHLRVNGAELTLLEVRRCEITIPEL